MLIYGLVLGLALFVAGVYIAANKNTLGESLYNFYTRPKRRKRFKFLDYRLVKPTRPLTNFMAWALGAAGASVGLIFVVTSLPK
jgi:hypothetical protein